MRMIFYLNSLNIHICVTQHYQESIGAGLCVVMLITSHNYDVINVCPDSVCITTTGSVTHDAIWSQILISDVIWNLQILIGLELDW